MTDAEVLPGTDTRPKGADDAQRRRREFLGWLAFVVAVALAVRLGYAFSRRHVELGGDPYYYHHQADLVARGKGFIAPFEFNATGRARPAADHPPLFILYLAAWSLVGATSPFWHLLANAFLGTASVVVLALTGRRLGGDRVGLVAGMLAALHPNLWVWDGLLAAETTAILAVALYLWAVVSYLARPSHLGLVWIAAAGAAAGLARAELVVLALAVVPLALRTTGLTARQRAAWLASAAAAVVLLLAPWTAYNIGRFDQPVALSTGLGLVAVSSDCDATWYGPNIGYWDFGCSTSGSVAARVDEYPDSSVRDARLRRVAWDYVHAHPGRIPAVVAARVGRMFGMFRPIQQARLQAANEGAESWAAGATMSTWYLLAGLALVGGVELRRRRVPLVALVAPVALMLLIAVFIYGIGRFRAPADTSVVLLAAVGVDALLRSRAEGGAPPAPRSVLRQFGRTVPHRRPVSPPATP